MRRPRWLSGIFGGFTVLALLHCGGQAASPPGTEAAGAGGSGAVGGACGAARSTPSGRAQGSSCDATPPRPPFLDAGTVACESDADCADAGNTQACLNGVCSTDQCLVDADCPAGRACGCRGNRVNVVVGNWCVEAQCRVDSDCGPGGVCSATYSSGCGSGIEGFYCHSSADTCNTSSDCCGNTPACNYQPALGHWACEGVVACNG